VGTEKTAEEAVAESDINQELLIAGDGTDQHSVGSSIKSGDEPDATSMHEGDEQSCSDNPSLEDQQFAKYINYGSADTIAERLALVAAHGGVAVEVACVCVMDYVETFMSTRWIKSKHLALLIACFRDGISERTEWGTYRVELVMLLFARLLVLCFNSFINIYFSDIYLFLTSGSSQF
jgi:hypothetical protein